MKYLLITLTLFVATIGFADNASKVEGCHKEAKDAVAEDASQDYKIDLNNDKELEYVFLSNCTEKQCHTAVVAKLKGCYSVIFSKQGDIHFSKDKESIFDEVELKLIKAKDNPKILDYMPLNYYSSSCSENTTHAATYLFDHKKGKYIEVYSRKFDVCDF